MIVIDIVFFLFCGTVVAKIGNDALLPILSAVAGYLGYRFKQKQVVIKNDDDESDNVTNRPDEQKSANN